MSYVKKAAKWGNVETNPAVKIEKFEYKKHKLKLTTEILFGKIYPNADIKLKTAIMLGFHLNKGEIKLIRKKTDKEIVIHINETLYQLLCYLKSKEPRHLANTSMKDAGVTVDKRMAVTGQTNIASNEFYTHKTVGDSIDAARSLEKFRPVKF